MTPDVLQNPSDPDATYRFKVGKSYRGYSANIVKTVDEKGSIVTDYQYDVNTKSDASFIKEYLESADTADETVALIADGAYASKENQRLAAEKNIGLLTTGLLGRKPREILAMFDIDEERKTIKSCPNGNAPKSSSYIWQTDSIKKPCFLYSSEYSLIDCSICPSTTTIFSSLTVVVTRLVALSSDWIISVIPMNNSIHKTNSAICEIIILIFIPFVPLKHCAICSYLSLESLYRYK